MDFGERKWQWDKTWARTWTLIICWARDEFLSFTTLSRMLSSGWNWFSTFFSLITEDGSTAVVMEIMLKPRRYNPRSTAKEKEWWKPKRALERIWEVKHWWKPVRQDATASSTASQGTSNIPVSWFLLLGCYRQARTLFNRVLFLPLPGFLSSHC